MSGEGLSQRGAEFQLQPVPASKRKRSTANNETPRIWAAPQPAAHAPLLATRPVVRLRRSQSVPNLKAKHSLDLSVKALHCIAVPARLVHAWNAQQQQRHQQQLQQQQLPQRYQQQVRVPPQQTGWSNVALRAPPQTSKPHTIATASSAVVSRVDCGLVSPVEASTPTQPSVYTPSILPPINSQTLRELDLHEILKNPQLRHDLVFDTDLQFRPNFDGERGRRKRDVGNKYWRAIQREIHAKCSCTSFHGNLELPCVCTVHRRRGSGPDVTQAASTSAGDARFYARIPSLIAELRCICLSILPTSTAKSMLGGDINIAASAPPRATLSFASQQLEGGGKTGMANPSSRVRMEPQTAAPAMGATHHAISDEHRAVMQCLDPTMIMQQLRHGVLDVMRLITTIASILKQHCAPMRDPLIESMVELATRQDDVTRSLRQCFEILELMKLDVANHQLSTSRVYLVDTAADFEGRWFRDQVLKGKVTLQRTIAWFNACLARQTSATPTMTRTAIISRAFDEGFLDLVFDPPSASKVTFNGGNGSGLASPCRLVSSGNTGQQTQASTPVTYPETFQFDAYRILTFHGEVTDISVVSMLLLLFRQLACSPKNLAAKELPYSSASGSTPATTLLSSLASVQLESVKSDIWTLLREAEAELTAGSAALDRSTLPSSTATTSGGPLPSPATAKPGGVASRVLDSRLLSWRKVVGDIVLQIAARAIQVQIEARRCHSAARSGSEVGDVVDELKLASDYAPSQSTLDLLTRWLETNLHAASPLFKLCRTRVRGTLAKFTVTSNIGTGAPSPALADSSPSSHSARKRTSASEATLPSAKRIRLHAIVPSSVHSMSNGESSVVSGASPTTPPSVSGDLEPFMAEIALLSERMNKVKSYHLQVYRCYYERLAIAQQHLQPPSTA